MGKGGDSEPRGGSAAAGKVAERRRLAEALRANLRRRKAQIRARQERDLTRGDAAESIAATQDD